MDYREYTPGAPLRPFIRCYWTLTATLASHPASQRIFPDGSMDMIFHLGDAFHRIQAQGEAEKQNPTLLAGQIWAPVEIQPGRQIDVVGVRFHPGGALPFLRFPQQEVAGHIADLGCFWGSRATAWRQRLGDMPPGPQRIAWLESQLLALHPQPLPPLSGLSPRQHRRRFEARVGIPPKLFARIARFRRAMDQLGRAPGAHIALDCGYFDQAHLIRDFRQFTGLSPSEWLRSQGDVLFFQDGVEQQASS